MVKQLVKKAKPFLRWVIMGLTLFFLLKTFKDRFAEITHISIDSRAWLILAIALVCTLLAHIWSAWVWTGILKIFQIPIGLLEGICVYLVTNIAKYLPGNVWHFYGRIKAIRQQGSSIGLATLSVVLEPLLMAASALLIAVVSTSFGLSDFSPLVFGGQIVALVVVLIGIHPRVLNPVLQKLSKGKSDRASVEIEDDGVNNFEATKTKTANRVQQPISTQTEALQTYPLLPFLGEIGFVLFRGVGFLFTVMAIQTIVPGQIPLLLSAFSIAWLLGLIVPGAPGGIGIFEATAIALLPQSVFPQANILLAVALYRVISILAEAIAAVMGWGVEKMAISKS